MHVELAGRFRHVTLAGFINALNMLPPDTVRGHWRVMLGGHVEPSGHQGGDDIVGVGGFGEVVEGAELDRHDRRCDRPVAGQDDPAGVGPLRLQGAHDVQPASVSEPEIDHGEGRGGGFDRGQRFGNAGGRPGGEAARGQRPRQAVAKQTIIVYDEKRLIERLSGARNLIRRLVRSVLVHSTCNSHKPFPAQKLIG